MLIPTDLRIKHDEIDQEQPIVAPVTPVTTTDGEGVVREAEELAREERARQEYIAALRTAQAAAERAVIDAVLGVGEAVDALYTIEKNLHAEGQPVETPGRMPGPAWDAVRHARRFWREWYPQLAGLPPLPGEAAPLEQARRRLARAQDALQRAKEAGKDEEYLESWRATIEIERRNVAQLEGQDPGSATPVLTRADKARLKKARRK
jgi:hypothetical protein